MRSTSYLESDIDKDSGCSDVGAGTTAPLEPLLVAAGTEQICIPLPDGSKKSVISHDDPETHISPEEVVGNYGLMPKGGVVYIDVDNPEVFPHSKDEFAWVQASVHGEGFHVAVETECPMGNRRMEWGELRAENQYIVGPGSEVDHDVSCDDCGCSGVDEYTPLSVGPLDVVGEEFWSTLGVEQSEDASVEAVPEADIESSEVDYSIEARIQKMLNGKNGPGNTALWEGRYRDAGYDDRSNAEMVLVMRLAFWMQKNEAAIRTAMNLACSDHPRTQRGDARKWAERTGIYRDVTVQNARQMVDNVYEGGGKSDILPFEEKPTVSYPTYERVLDAVSDLGLASSSEIADHPRVDRSQRQVRNALNELIDDGVIERIVDGPQTRYYLPLLKDKIPLEQRGKYGI